jgi:hypothetical protein
VNERQYRPTQYRSTRCAFDVVRRRHALIASDTTEKRLSPAAKKSLAAHPSSRTGGRGSVERKRQVAGRAPVEQNKVLEA